MFWLVVPALAGQVPLCLDEVPAKPRPATRAEFDPANPPRVLVPMGWHADGEVRPSGGWHDDQGRRYRYRDVEAALMDNPLSEPSYVAYRRSLDDEIPPDPTPLDRFTLTGMPPTVALKIADLRSFEGMERHQLLRALCVFNATQGPRLEQAVARDQLMAEITGIRGPDDPPMAVWAVTSRLYEAMGAEHPEDPAAWRADVAAVSEAIDGGAEPDALIARVGAREGSLAERMSEVPPPEEPPPSP